ncbi:hypothetical protein NUM3379_36240 [Kineococcus sp. NUM-3379]
MPSSTTPNPASPRRAARRSVPPLVVLALAAGPLASPALAADTTAPAAVRGMVTSSDRSRAKLDWTGNTEKDLAGYLVYRATSPGGNFTRLTAAPRTSSDYSDTTAPAGFPSYYRVSAVDTSGNESAPVSATVTRKDGVAPAAPKALTAVRTAAGVVLEWADNTEADLAGYVVSRASTSGGTYTRLTATALTASTFTDTTAAAGVNHHYRVTAVDHGGYASSTASVAVLLPDTTAPAAVRGAVTSATTSGVRLDWASNGESDLAGYHVYRASSADGEFTKLTAAPRTSSDYTDTTAPAGVVSHYRVTAVDRAGNESAAVALSATRPDGVAPAAPRSLTTTGTATGVVLDWADSTEADLAGYVVSRASSSGGTYTRLTATPVTGSTYTDTTAPAGVVSYYRVSAVDTSGNTSATASATGAPADLLAPAPVTGMVTSADTSRIKLDWTGNTERDLAGYLVYRASSADGEFTKLTATPRTSSDYSDTTAPAGVVSHYRVTAVDRSGNESAAVTVSAVRRDTTAPAVVTGLSASGDANGVVLDWADSTEADLAGYVVSRASGAGGTWARLTATPVTGSAFTDTTAPAGVVSYYRVSAVDTSGNTSATASASARRTDTVAPAVPAGLAAERATSGTGLSWSAVGDADLAGYVVYRWSTEAGPLTGQKLTASPLRATTFADTGAEAGVGWSYAVAAVDTSGNESPTSEPVAVAAVDVTAPAVPGGLTATGSAGAVELDWADGTEPDLAGYLVSRAPGAEGAEFTPLTTTPVTTSAFTDTTAVPGTAYRYRVTALDTTGNASTAVEVQGTRPVEKVPVAGADVTVAADGSGDHTTIAAALAAAPAGNAPFVIGVRPGTYRETLAVTRAGVTLLGATANASDVVITYGNSAGTPKADGTGTLGTSGSATVLIRGNDVTVKNLTIQNDFVETGAAGEQAVALKTVGDRLVFDNVRLLGDQDTLYADSPGAGVLARSYYVNSYVEGDVDFIFGRGTAVFDRSTIKAATRGSTSNNGYITAPSTDRSLTFGFLVTDSTITSDAPAGTFSLGRPWQPSGDVNAVGQVLVRDTELPAAVRSSPWTDFGTSAWRNARLSEFGNSGPGAGTNADRPQLSAAEAARFTKFTYLAGADGWNPTGQTPPPPPADTTAPAVPAGLGAEAADSSVALTWTAVGDGDLAGYNVYRSTGSTVALTDANRLNPAPLTAPGHTDRTAANGSSYTYVVTAVDRAGNESAAGTAVTASPVGVALPAHDVLVAADGSGQHTSVQAALAAAPAGTAAKPTVIAVKPGVYREMITVSRNFVTIVGTTGRASDVVLTYDNAAGTTVPGTTTTYGTGRSQSVLISGSNVTVRDLTIENSFDEAAVVLSGEQAVALKTTGDRLVFENVRLLGNQDTLLVDSPDAPRVARSYFYDSYVEGDVDFIFGRGTAVFDRSTIHALSRGSNSNNGYITAASTSDKNPYGFLITDSTITSNAPAGTYSLGRPWRGWADGYTVGGVVHNSRGQVTIRNTALPAAVRTTQPWADMSPNLWTDGRFSEHGNTGPGAGVNANRPQLSDADAAGRTAQAYLAGTDGWNPVR